MTTNSRSLATPSPGEVSIPLLVSRLWESISGGFRAGLGDIPERIGGLLEPLHVFGEVGRERVGLDGSVRIEADC